MRIHNITPVSFGYSEKSTNWLNNKTSTIEDKELARNIRTCNSICNSMEDEIDRIEIRNSKVKPNSDFMDFYISLKGAVLSSVLSLFDDGNEYLESEYDYYAGDLEKAKDKDKNWRNRVIEGLRFWDANLGRSSEEIERENQAVKNRRKAEQQAKVTETLKTIGNQVEQAKTSTDSNPIIERLKKTEFSPNGFDDVMGMEKLKAELREDIVEPANDPERARLDFVEYGKRMPAGVLLYGPPGCGKTYITDALASEIESPVYIMNSANTGSKFVNQTSNNIKKAFEHVYSEGEKSDRPVFIFLDEMDAMTTRDGHVSNEDIKQTATLLKYIEEAKAHNVIVIGATNRYDMVDPAIRRRFDVKRYVGLPDNEQRMQLLRNNLKHKAKGQKLLGDGDALSEISKKLNGFSSHSVNIIADEASLRALRRNRADISKEDFELAIKETEEERIDEKGYLPNCKKPKLGFSSN